MKIQFLVISLCINNSISACAHWVKWPELFHEYWRLWFLFYTTWYNPNMKHNLSIIKNVQSDKHIYHQFTSISSLTPEHGHLISRHLYGFSIGYHILSMSGQPTSPSTPGIYSHYISYCSIQHQTFTPWKNGEKSLILY